MRKNKSIIIIILLISILLTYADDDVNIAIQVMNGSTGYDGSIFCDYNLYYNEIGGSSIYYSNATETIEDGILSVSLQNITSINWDQNIWFGWACAGDNESIPRLKLGAGHDVLNNPWNWNQSGIWTKNTSLNVGVGTSTPAYRLHVVDNGGGSPVAYIEADDATPYALSIGRATYSTDPLEGLRIYLASGVSEVYAADDGVDPHAWSFNTDNARRLVIGADGKVGVGTDLTPEGQLDVDIATSSVVGLKVQGAASQSANLQEWQNSSGGVLASMNAAGRMFVPDGSLTTPSYSFTDDPDTGISAAGSDELDFTTGGSARFFMNSGTFGAVNGAYFQNEVASSTNPTILPKGDSDIDTGLGWAGVDNLSLITGGVERIRIASDGEAYLGSIGDDYRICTVNNGYCNQSGSIYSDTHTHDTGNLTNLAGLDETHEHDAANITNEIWVNAAGDAMTGNLTMESSSIHINRSYRMCFGEGCEFFICVNSSGTPIITNNASITC